MATSITNKYLNNAKRESEALVVTLPSVLDVGGGRLNTAPTIAQYGEAYTATVAPKEAITGKAYLLVEEAFPALSTATVSIGGTAIFTAAVITSTGLTVSATEDILLAAGGDVSITIGGGTGDIASGKLKVIVNNTPYSVKNGRYSETPAL